MQKLLIAESSDTFSAELAQKFRRRYQVEICSDGMAAQELAVRLHPDVMILDLMLPKLDGITLLTNIREQRPKIILAITRMTSGYIQQAVKDLGVSYLMMKPCSPDAVFRRLTDIVSRSGCPSAPDMQELAGAVLQKLGFSEKLEGYHLLRVGLPLYGQDPEMVLTKEFYPSAASLCGISDWRAAEHAVRMSIRKAWQTRDPEIWHRYFPDLKNTCPTAKTFLRRIAALLTAHAEFYGQACLPSRQSGSDLFRRSM